MSKKILISLSVIGVVAAIVIGATTAFFSDTETSTGNTLTAGVVDIVVNGENPWEASGEFTLDDMKPSYTKYIEFTVRNLVGSNPINLWKRIDITGQDDGVVSEPECTEGGGTWTWTVDPGEGTCIENYVPRNNLAAYTLYDLYVDEEPIISEGQYVRLDNIDGVWIYLGEMKPDEEIVVKQSYHLSSWPNAPEPEVTNWAQGDVMTFDIKLMATQMNAPGPEGAQATLNMVEKDPTTWEEVGDGSGILTYNTSGPIFVYNFSGTGLDESTEYCLIYYADPWPGTNGFDIECKLTDGAGALVMNGSKDIGSIPVVSDSNHPAGAKIWLVPSADYDTGADKMIGWSPSTYLFEENLITYTK